MGSLGTGYLVCYNVAQTFGWLWILVKAILALTSGSDLWTAISFELKVFQTLAVLEVLHTIVGLVRSNPLLTAVQVASRLFCLWGVLNYSGEARASIGLPLAVVSWSLAEIIRYSFYAVNLLNVTVPLIVWLRYTMFIVLYPTGVSGELISTYYSLGKVARERPWSLDMPNRLNFGFDPYVAVVAVMLSYIPVFPELYGHMLAQRKKVLKSKRSD